jgi:Zn-dependent peptidase ImmA (M78 family)
MRNLSFNDDANRILDKYAAGPFPLGIIEVANDLGIEVFLDSEYYKDKCGHTEISDDGVPSITVIPSIIVNKNDSYGRQRFTIAHEIAHCLMDLDYIKQHGSIDRDGKASDETYRNRERKANSFAAELLMPEKEFLRQFQVTNGNLEILAKFFGVSNTAARIRAFELGTTNVI